MATGDLAYSSPSSGRASQPRASPLMAFPASVGDCESLSTSWNVELGGKLDNGFLTDDEVPMFPADPQPTPHLKVFVDEDEMQTIRRAKEPLAMKEELAARLPPGPSKPAAH